MCGQPYALASMEVRGQSMRVDALLPPCGLNAVPSAIWHTFTEVFFFLEMRTLLFRKLQMARKPEILQFSEIFRKMWALSYGWV